MENTRIQKGITMKKVTTFAVSIILLSGCAAIFAATRPLAANTSEPSKALPQSSELQGKIVEETSEKQTENPPATEITLKVPTITQSIYYHKGTVYNEKGRTQIRWDEVENAESYEIEIIKVDGTTKIYTSKTGTLMLYDGDDDFINGCLKVWKDSRLISASVRVRAVGANDQVSSWSEETKIRCNGVHSSLSSVF